MTRLFAIVLFASTLTAQAQAQAPERVRPLADALPFYERYLRLPLSVRDGLEMRYTLRGPEGGPPPAVTFIRDGRRTPLQLGPGGRVSPPTDLATLRATQVAVAGRASLGLDVVPILPLSTRIPVAAINNCLGDYGAARRSAGVLALAAPNVRGIVFAGVRAAAAEMADGRRVALPTESDGDVVFRPGDRAMRGTVAVVFAAPPTRAAFAQ